jgi:multimeric flavodoxin WrbA
MKVLLLNGSPHASGSTYTALAEVQRGLADNGVATEFFHIGTKPVRGCIACKKCKQTKRCVFTDDVACALSDKISECDGLVIGSPVYYASANGALVALLDRVFYADGDYAGKLGASVAVARRAGTTATMDVLNKYFSISNMPIVSSFYWNMVHGHNPEQVRQDIEGMQIMYAIGQNMAWLLGCIEAGEKAGIKPPVIGPITRTNFIR